MGRLPNAWRRLAGALIACFLAVFALTPAFDAVICETEEPAAAHAVVDQAADHQTHPGHTDNSGLCGHGHFHQASSEAPACMAVGAPIRLEQTRFVLPPPSAAPSSRHFPPIRPPRA